MNLPLQFYFRTAICLIFACRALLAHDPHDPISAIAVSPNFAQDQTVFAATEALTVKNGAYVLLKSTDGGLDFSPVPNIQNCDMVRQIVFSPAYSQDQTLYVAGHGGMFKTTDQGATWTVLSQNAIRSLALSPNFVNDHTLFLVTDQNAILQSTNGGKTLVPLSRPAPHGSTLNVIAVSPNYTVDKTLLLGSDKDGIFESTDAGASWVLVTAGLTLPPVESVVFSPGFSTDHSAFAGTLGQGFLKTTNGGTTWAASNSGLTDLNVSYVALSPTFLQDSTLWITSAVDGVFQSSSAGASWSSAGTASRKLSGLTNVHYIALAAAGTGSAPMLYLGMFEGLWTSTHGLPAWDYIDNFPTRLARDIDVSPNFTQDHTVFANTYGGGNLWSTDGGITWTFQNIGMVQGYTDSTGFSPNYAVDKTVFSSDPMGIQKSTDRGATWQLTKGLGVMDYPRAMAVSPNFANDSTILMGCKKPSGGAYSGLFISPDAGNTWQQTGLTGTGVFSIAMSPTWATDRTAFAASPDTGLYKSTDGAVTWTSVAGMTQKMALTAISPNFANDKTVVAAPMNLGLYRSTDGGTTWTLLPGTAFIRPMVIRFSPNYAVDQTIWVGTMQKGLVKLTKGGDTINYVTSLPQTWVGSIGISPNFANDQTIFTGTYWGIFKSTDGGSTWTYTAEPARVEEFREVASRYAPQNPPTIVYNGNWSFPNPSLTASTNEYALTSDSRAKAVFNFYGTGVRWISWTGPNQGQAAIALDGVSEGTITLTAPTDQYQQNVWEQHGIACGPHQFSVTPKLGPGQTISIDAFDYWVDTCPQVSGSPALKNR